MRVRLPLPLPSGGCMYKVFKYPLKITEQQFIELPQDAEPLKIMVQRGIPCLWVRLLEGSDTIPWEIFTVGTGHPAPSEKAALYLDSYMIEGDSLVFHVFTT